MIATCGQRTHFLAFGKIEGEECYVAQHQPEPSSSLGRRRGRRNEPAFVRRTLEVLAEVRRTDFHGLAAATAENASRVFRVVA